MYRAIRTAAAVGLALTGIACTAGPKKPGAGDPFPDIAVPATQAELVKKGAKELSIADLKGKFVVIAFYPKALTGGCTIECNGFRDLLEEFKAADAVVIGASVDTVDLNQQFTDTHKYAYPLLCDADKKLVTALGIKAANGMAMRVTYIVDKDGKIAKVYDTVTPESHPEEVLKEVRALAGKK